MADRLIVQEQSDGRVAVALQRAGQLIAEPAGEPIAFAAPLDAEAREDLRWYLEDYLTAPFGVYEERGPAIAGRLSGWGEALFEALFGAGKPGRDDCRIDIVDEVENRSVGSVDCNDDVRRLINAVDADLEGGRLGQVIGRRVRQHHRHGRHEAGKEAQLGDRGIAAADHDAKSVDAACVGIDRPEGDLLANGDGGDLAVEFDDTSDGGVDVVDEIRGLGVGPGR